MPKIHIYEYVSGFEKTTHFTVKINFEIWVLIQSTVTVLSVALCCASIAPLVPEICFDCEKNGNYILLLLHQTFRILSVY